LKKTHWAAEERDDDLSPLPSVGSGAETSQYCSTRRAGQKYLIQHSAGSGKSNSIAWLTHQLASLSQGGDKLFDSVIVVTDRTVLDSQLQETIGQFDHASGVVSRINRDEGDSKSAQLAEALANGTPIIIVTIQTFPYVLKAIQESTTLKSSRFAVVADEAHSSQSGSTARQLREVLMAEQMEDEMSAEDMMNLTLAARGGSKNISYFFTATPKGKTLELFGRPDKLDMPLGQRTSRNLSMCIPCGRPSKKASFSMY
jgi:type I restriction enzyme R subunit